MSILGGLVLLLVGILIGMLIQSACEGVREEEEGNKIMDISQIIIDEEISIDPVYDENEEQKLIGWAACSVFVGVWVEATSLEEAVMKCLSSE